MERLKGLRCVLEYSTVFLFRFTHISYVEYTKIDDE